MEKTFGNTRQNYAIFVLVMVLVLVAVAAFIFTRQQQIPVTGDNSAERAAPAKLSAPSSGPNPVYEYNLSRPPAFSSNKMTQSSGPNPVYEYNLSRPPAANSGAPSNASRTYIGDGLWLVTGPDGNTFITH